MGYMQGMCDLVAPLLVMMHDEATAHALFSRLMSRATDNFPSGQAMDAHFADMRYINDIAFCAPFLWFNEVSCKQSTRL